MRACRAVAWLHEQVGVRRAPIAGMLQRDVAGLHARDVVDQLRVDAVGERDEEDGDRQSHRDRGDRDDVRRRLRQMLRQASRPIIAGVIRGSWRDRIEPRRDRGRIQRRQDGGREHDDHRARRCRAA